MTSKKNLSPSCSSAHSSDGSPSQPVCKSNPPSHKPHPPPPPSFGGVPLSDEDLCCLDQFCAQQAPVESMTYDEFCQVHRNLDVMITVSLSEHQRQQGGSRMITFTRTICVDQKSDSQKPSSSCMSQSRHSTDSHEDAWVREYVEVICEVSWHGGISWNDTVCLKQMGDQDGDHRRGDVIVRFTPFKGDLSP